MAKKAIRKTAKKKRTTAKAKSRPSATRKKTAAKKTAARTAAKSKKAARSTKSTPRAVVARRKRPARPKKPTSGLMRRDIEQFRQLLLEKRRELVGDVTTLQDEALHKNSQDAAGNPSTMPQHMADIGTDNYEQEFALVLVAGERALLGEIDEALQRIEAGAFGICQATGKPIGKARLKAKPWAKFCYEHVLALETGRIRGT